MEKMRIEREFQFDAAHMLSDYDGLCANLHGHTYTGKVVIEGVVQEDGMVVDYNMIKEAVKPLDHAVIFAHEGRRDEAEEDLLRWAQKHNKRYIEIPLEGAKPTAEYLAQFLAGRLWYLNPGLEYVRVELHETPGSTADYTFSEHES